MLKQFNLSVVIVIGVLTGGIGRDIYVSPDGTNNFPYTNWPDAATNIEYAVNAAANGDTVWITNGTYVLTNQITVNSGILICGWPEGSKPVIDGNNSNRCFYIPSAVCTLSNLFITRGYTNGNGGGVYRGILLNCTLFTNYAANGGGAYNSQATNCNFISNVAATNGGGTYNGTYSYCTFASNVANIGGGGCYACTLSNCFVSNNIAANSGGGFYADNNQVKNCVIARNKTLAASGNGGGGAYITTPALVQDCIIEENTSCCGGGVSTYTGSLRDCLIRNNVAFSTTEVGGGGIYCGGYTRLVYIRGCTIVSNYTGYAGGGISFGLGTHGPVKFENCIIYFNACPPAGVSSNYYIGSGSAAFTNCCLAPAVSDAVAPGSTNNISDNPQFADRVGDNYRLSKTSPCVNTGINRDWMADSSDLDGHHRLDVFSGFVDMGCFEYIPSGSMYSVR